MRRRFSSRLSYIFGKPFSPIPITVAYPGTETTQKELSISKGVGVWISNLVQTCVLAEEVRDDLK